MKRRTFLKGSSMVSLAAFSLPLLSCIKKGEKAFRVVHMTDIHLKAEGPSLEGFAKALKKINSLDIKPNFILNGGDAIFDAMFTSKAGTEEQWKQWHAILEKENHLPIRNCIGNHDIWGWGLDKEHSEEEIQFGKDWAVKELDIENRYYSFDNEDWHFIVLDSIQPKTDRNYFTHLDEEQWAWLEKDLKKSKNKPTCVISHAPLLSFCHQLFKIKEESGEEIILPEGSLVHADTKRIKDLFYKNKQIKLSLSGHIHMQEEVDYLGVKYLCNGAVSGNWWKGAFQEFEPAFAVIDLFPDGSIKHQWISY